MLLSATGRVNTGDTVFVLVNIPLQRRGDPDYVESGRMQCVGEGAHFSKKLLNQSAILRDQVGMTRAQGVLMFFE
jgi:hypothetical protein